MSWWPGDGNANDIIGRNPGTLVNGATFAPGMVGQAFSLDGVDDYIDVGTGFNLDAMTLDAWVFVDPATNTGERDIITKDNFALGGPRKIFALRTSSPDSAGNQGRAAFGVCVSQTGDQCSGGPGATRLVDTIQDTAPLTAGWHHLAGVRDTAAGRFELYVDGALVASKSAPFDALGPVDPVANTVIGQLGPQFNGQFFQGLIDEVEIYNRALSASEIQAIFNAGSAGKCKPLSTCVTWSSSDPAVATIDPTGLATGVSPEDLDHAFKDPPRSSEQILHPEKYWDDAKRDEPRAVALADLSAVLGKGWSLAGRGNLGELNLAILAGAGRPDIHSPEIALPATWTNGAASGWGGDLWHHYVNDGKSATLLVTLWDTERDAGEFEAALRRDAGRPFFWRGDAVVIVGGDAGDRAGALAQAALDAVAISREHGRPVVRSGPMGVYRDAPVRQP